MLDEIIRNRMYEHTEHALNSWACYCQYASTSWDTRLLVQDSRKIFPELNIILRYRSGSEVLPHNLKSSARTCHVRRAAKFKVVGWLCHRRRRRTSIAVVEKWMRSKTLLEQACPQPKFGGAYCIVKAVLTIGDSMAPTERFHEKCMCTFPAS